MTQPQAPTLVPGLDVERLTLALERCEINCWANPVRHKITDKDEHRQHRLDAAAIAREYDRLASPAVLPVHAPDPSR